MPQTVFNERMRIYRDYMGLTNTDLMGVLDRSRTAVFAYMSDDPDQARVPEWSALIDIPRRLGLSLDWLSGLVDGPMWAPAITAQRLTWRLGADAVSDPAVPAQERMAQVVRMIMVTPVQPLDQPWFVAGMLGLTDRGSKYAIPAFERFMLGSGAAPQVMKRAMQRLADFTGLPDLWLQLGEKDYLPAVTTADLGAWATNFARLQSAGVSPEAFSLHSETIINMINAHESRVKA